MINFPVAEVTADISLTKQLEILSIYGWNWKKKKNRDPYIRGFRLTSGGDDCWGSSTLCSEVKWSCSVMSDSLRLCGLLPGSSVHRILQARIPEWVAIPSSRGSFPPRDWTHISYVFCIGSNYSFIYEFPTQGYENWLYCNSILPNHLALVPYLYLWLYKTFSSRLWFFHHDCHVNSCNCAVSMRGDQLRVFLICHLG